MTGFVFFSLGAVALVVMALRDDGNLDPMGCWGLAAGCVVLAPGSLVVS